MVIAILRETALALSEVFCGMELPFESDDMGDLVGEIFNILAGDVAAIIENVGFHGVNPAFERLTGLSSSEILNRRVTDVLPGITDDEFNWIGKFGEIVCYGGEIEFEQYSKPLDKWFRVQAGSSEKGFFSTLFVDITDMKRTEEEQNLLLDNINTQIWYLRDLEHYGKVNRAHAGFLGLSEKKLQEKNVLLSEIHHHVFPGSIRE